MKRYLAVGLNYEKTHYALPDCHLDAQAVATAATDAGYSGAMVFKCSAIEFSDRIEAIQKAAKPGDTTLISFSGHGTQWDGGNEKDEMEEGLCFWNGGGIEVIPDNDFRKLIDRIPGTVYVFLDSCFSGGMARRLRGRPKLSGQWSGRFIPFEESFAMFGVGNDLKSRALRFNRQYYLLACAEGEVSWSTGSGGLFTKTFVSNYGAMPRTTRTIKAIMARTRSACTPDQTPTVEIFGGAASKKIF